MKDICRSEKSFHCLTVFSLFLFCKLCGHSKASEGQQQQNGELAGKLQTKSSECDRLEDQLIDLRGKLEMTELYVEQVPPSSAPLYAGLLNIYINNVML